MSTQQAFLRPLGMGVLLDRAIRLYRRNFTRFVGVIAVMLIPVSGVELIVTLATYETVVEAIPTPEEISASEVPLQLLGPDYYASVATNMLVQLVYLVLINGIASAALTRLVADSYLGEQPAGAFDAYKAIGDRWGTLVRAILLFLALSLLTAVWVIVPCIGWLTGPGMVVVLAGMVLPLLAPVVVMESFGARKSLRRAWELVRARFWWILGFMVLLVLFNIAIAVGPSLLGGLALGLLVPAGLEQTNPDLFASIQLASDSLVTLAFNLLYLPLQLTCLTLLYFDLRVRQEGLDLILAAESGGQSRASWRDLIAQHTSLPGTALISGRELLNFSILTLLILGLYAVLVFGVAGILIAAGAV